MNEDDIPCPKCGSLGIGEPIPEKYRHVYGDNTHYSTRIGIEYAGGYDGVEDWQCRECRHVWGRFPWSRAGKVKNDP